MGVVIQALFVLAALTPRGGAAQMYVDRLTAGGPASGGDYVLHGDAGRLGGPSPNALRMPDRSYAEWTPKHGPVIDQGTLTMWVTPLWGANDTNSHVFATFKWSGGDRSYFALSQGWWEPEGARKLQVVLSNQQVAGCRMPWNFDFQMFLPDMKTMLGVTWQAGSPGFVRLFVDGRRVCSGRLDYSPGRRLSGPMYLGSDLAAEGEHRGRPSGFVMENLVVSNRVSSDEDMRREFMGGGGGDREKWILALTAPAVDRPPEHERRLMLDEDTQWASSKLEIQRRLDRIRAAGFNMYAPCVWDGAVAYFRAAGAPIAPAVRGALDPSYDPLSYLIARAHDMGIEVHPWVVVARHAGGDFPRPFLDGAPEHAFNVQSAAFRDFIVALASEVAAHYDVDGVNLDYVRAIGPCSSKECIDAYRRTYHRGLMEDWNSALQGQDVPAMMDWNRRPITDIVSRISAGVRAVKPGALLTVDTIPFDHDRQHQGMDEAAWLRAGLVDALVEMAYDDPLDMDALDEGARVWPADQQIIALRNYDIFGNSVTNRPGVLMADYVRLIRSRWPGFGIAFYHYPHMDAGQIHELRLDVFSQYAHAR